MTYEWRIIFEVYKWLQNRFLLGLVVFVLSTVWRINTKFPYKFTKFFLPEEIWKFTYYPPLTNSKKIKESKEEPTLEPPKNQKIIRHYPPQPVEKTKEKPNLNNLLSQGGKKNEERRK